MANGNNVGWTLKQAAQALNVSEMTVRRRIKAGKLPAREIAGKYGKEWLITELAGKTESNDSVSTDIDLMAMIRELQQENRDLAIALGEARGQVKLLNDGRKPWYRRLFS